MKQAVFLITSHGEDGSGPERIFYASLLEKLDGLECLSLELENTACGHGVTLTRTKVLR